VLALFTIGYQESTPDAVLGTLAATGARLVVDVRAVAASRRPGFSKRQLAAGLAEAGIGYLHLRGLGTPPDGRAAARAGRHDEMRRIYGAHLATEAAQGEMAELARLVAEGSPLCLLCFERRAEHCHRRVLSERLERRLGVEVVDLVP
jgi:uncharacterized protein (DUF488 family)